jgi:hypothetical protein
MRLRIEREIPCGIETAWHAECDPHFLNILSWPFLSFIEQGDVAKPYWREGECHLFTVRLLGIFPFGNQNITVEKLDPKAKSIITCEEGTFIRSWRHEASFHPMASTEAKPGHCRYRDDISFDAGYLSPLVWLSAWVFYQYRQARRAAWAHRQ